MKNLKIIYLRQKDFKGFFNSTVYIFSAFFGLVIGVLLFYSQLARPIYLIILIFLPLLSLFFKKDTFLFVLIYFLFFVFLGFLRAVTIDISVDGLIEGKAIISGFVRESKFSKQASLKILESNINQGFSINGRFDKDSKIMTFDKIVFNGEIRKSHRYKNIGYTPYFYENFLNSRKNLVVKNYTVYEGNSLAEKILFLREKILEKFKNLKRESKNFFIEVLFGDKTVEESKREVFGRTGIAHILSISGLHFALTILFAYFIAYAVVFIFPDIVDIVPRQVLTIIFSIPLLIVYAILSGLSIPSFRAFLFFLLSSTFLLFFKKVFNSLNLIFLVAFIFVFFDPSIIGSTSFQLSFLSVFALIILYKKQNIFVFEEKKYINKFFSYPASIAISSITISLFIFPVIQSFAKQNLVASVFANVVVIPLFSFLVLPFLFISLPFAFINEDVFTALLFIPDLGWKIIYNYSTFLNKVFSPMVFELPFSVTNLFLYYFFLLLMFFLKGKKKFLVLIVGIISIIQTMPKPIKGPVLIFPDVGQGDCSVIKTGEGKVIFIDVGGNIWDESLFNKVYVPLMRKLGTKKIDYLIISHEHPDHSGMIKWFLSNYEVKNIIGGKWLSAIEGEGKKTIVVDHPYFIKENDVKGIIFPGLNGKGENNSSLWTYMEIGDSKILFTGDTERKGIDYMLEKVSGYINKITILKVPHHGASSSFEKKLYDLNPEFAIVTVGERNPWKLPSKIVLDFLRKNKIRFFRTDIDGEIIYDFTEKKFITYKNYYGI